MKKAINQLYQDIISSPTRTGQSMLDFVAGVIGQVPAQSIPGIAQEATREVVIGDVVFNPRFAARQYNQASQNTLGGIVTDIIGLYSNRGMLKFVSSTNGRRRTGIPVYVNIDHSFNPDTLHTAENVPPTGNGYSSARNIPSSNCESPITGKAHVTRSKTFGCLGLNEKVYKICDNLVIEVRRVLDNLMSQSTTINRYSEFNQTAEFSRRLGTLVQNRILAKDYIMDAVQMMFAAYYGDRMGNKDGINIMNGIFKQLFQATLKGGKRHTGYIEIKDVDATMKIIFTDGVKEYEFDCEADAKKTAKSFKDYLANKVKDGNNGRPYVSVGTVTGKPQRIEVAATEHNEHIRIKDLQVVYKTTSKPANKASVVLHTTQAMEFRDGITRIPYLSKATPTDFYTFYRDFFSDIRHNSRFINSVMFLSPQAYSKLKRGAELTEKGTGSEWNVMKQEDFIAFVKGIFRVGEVEVDDNFLNHEIVVTPRNNIKFGISQKAFGRKAKAYLGGPNAIKRLNQKNNITESIENSLVVEKKSYPYIHINDYRNVVVNFDNQGHEHCGELEFEFDMKDSCGHKNSPNAFNA